MALPVPDTEPRALVAGDSWVWTKLLPDFPAGEGWELRYALRHHLHAAPIDLIATADGDGHRIQVPAATTAAYGPGEWTWQSFVVNATSGERHTLETGILSILPSFSSQTGAFDGRSESRRLLDAVRALLSGRALSDAASYQIEGRAITKLAPRELEEWEARFALRAAREEGRTGIRWFGFTDTTGQRPSLIAYPTHRLD